jgi:hypothetical protein
MTTRRWMIAVAVVAMVGASVRMVTLRARYLVIAQWRAEDAVDARDRAEFWDGQAELVTVKGSGSAEVIAYDRAEAASARAWAAWNDRMNRKYMEAARHPWFPVEPDPPSPSSVRSLEARP